MNYKFPCLNFERRRRWRRCSARETLLSIFYQHALSDPRPFVDRSRISQKAAECFTWDVFKSNSRLYQLSKARPGNVDEKRRKMINATRWIYVFSRKLNYCHHPPNRTVEWVLGKSISLRFHFPARSAVEANVLSKKREKLLNEKIMIITRAAFFLLCFSKSS